MPTIQHPLSATDAEAMRTLRARLLADPFTPTRDSFDAMAALTSPCPGVTYRDDVLDGVPGTWCEPATAKPGRALLYLHGGAFVFGRARAFCNFVGHLAAAARVAAFVADYRLAPEHPFPAARDDAMRAYAALARLHGAAGVAVAGDSAGGGLALSATTGTSSRGVLLSPWTDLTLTAPSLDARADDDPLLSRAALSAGARAYLGAHDPQDARVSPRFGALASLPPLQVHVGTAEVLLDDALALAELAHCEVHVWEGLPHVFPRSVGTFEAAREAIALAGAFLRDEDGGARAAH